jgi:hypothetical protein
LSQAFRPAHQPLKGGDRLTQKAEPFLQLGNTRRQFLRPARSRPGQHHADTDYRSEENENDEDSRHKAGDMQTLQHPHCGLQHQHQYEGEDNRQ